MKRRTKTRSKQRTRTRTKRRRTVPDPKTVVSESELRSASGRIYRVIRTTQTDPYDAPSERGKSRSKH